MSKTWGFFLVAQDMVLSHHAKFQLIINFFRVKAISTGLLPLKTYIFYQLIAKKRQRTFFSEVVTAIRPCVLGKDT